jgi:hypothetical protein
VAAKRGIFGLRASAGIAVTSGDDMTYVYDDMTYVYDDVTYVYDDVTYAYAYDDVTYVYDDLGSARVCGHRRHHKRPHGRLNPLPKPSV